MVEYEKAINMRFIFRRYYDDQDVVERFVNISNEIQVNPAIVFSLEPKYIGPFLAWRYIQHPNVNTLDNWNEWLKANINNLNRYL
jgi:hypothetical protein